MKLTEKNSERFQCRKAEVDHIQFSGIEIEKSREGFFVHKMQYLNKVKPIPKGSNFSAFRSIRPKLFWVSQTRPQISCAVVTQAQSTEIRCKDPKEKHKKKLKAVINHF